MSLDATAVAAIAIALLAGLSIYDLHRAEAGSITVYTTPALRDFLEKGVMPRWRAEGGMRVEPVYVAAGQEYNRLRMSGYRPEADLFMHASPLFIAKGHDQGYFLPLNVTLGGDVIRQFRQNTSAQEVAWIAFAWSPLVEVYAPGLAQAPDLATSDLRYGLAHPSLSNNGVYTVLLLEKVSPQAGAHARAQTVVQPVNARTNILGVADGSFDVTLGYEAVAKFFHAQGADIQWQAPVIEGRRVTTPVLFSAGLVDGPHTDEARRFVDFLFTNETQASAAGYHLRSVFDPPAPAEGPDAVELLHFDWRDWGKIEALLPTYEEVQGR